MPQIILVIGAVAVLGGALLWSVLRYRRLVLRHSALETAHTRMRERYSVITNADEEAARIVAEANAERARAAADGLRIVADAEAERVRAAADAQRLRAEQEQSTFAFQQQQALRAGELRDLQARIGQLHAEFQALDEEANLQSFGFYKPRYDFADSDRYQARLEQVRQRQKELISAKAAAVCNTEWTVNGSRVEGRKQTNHTLKLILRAFNGECDAAIAKVKYNNIGVMQTRIRKADEAINALVQIQSCEITWNYLELKLDELSLVHEYQEKVQAEKEEQRRIREQMREEEIALREMEKARQEAEKEEKRYADALRKAQEEAERTVGAKHDALMLQIAELQRRVDEAQANKQRAIARAQMTRSGHVYVISNIGSFGEQVYKIGMTRRLDPMERVRELGDASVPFQFDVHAVIYTEDAPALETALHRRFQHRRVNLVNERKEFFSVQIDEIATAVREHHGDFDVTLLAEAEEYRKTLAIRAERQQKVQIPSLAVPIAATPESSPVATA
ncbi:MAG TPA: DUF4041 domain-containing protein [Longimicrobium sp.]|nr:DUF4041 domain-containing protein [Longimicrobium sp.]